jgi:hypothetical protein
MALGAVLFNGIGPALILPVAYIFSIQRPAAN